MLLELLYFVSQGLVAVLQVGIDAVQGMLVFFGAHELFFQDLDLALSKREDGSCVLLGVVQLLRELLNLLGMLLHLLSEPSLAAWTASD